MDHLPGPNISPLTFCIGKNTYDPKKCRHANALWKICPKCRTASTRWDLYPERAGWEKKAADESVSFEVRERQAVQDYLSWLYFGVLSTYFEHSISMDIFLQDIPGDRSGAKHITTERLHEQLTKWHKSMLLRSRNDYEKWSATVNDMFTALIQKCHGLLDNEGEFPEGSFLALQLLYETLDCAKRKIDGVEYDRYEWLIGDELLKKMLVKNSWCPSEIQRAAGSASIPLYIAKLGVRRQDTHYSCGKWRCERGQINENNYEVRHVDERNGNDPPMRQDSQTSFGNSLSASNQKTRQACKLNTVKRECDMVSISSAALIEIILDMQLVPLVKSNVEGDIEVMGRRVDECVYVAISHVWADGAGNPYSNGLPRCQILQILSQMRMLGDENDGSLPWFIDTLCVPVAQPGDSEFQRDRAKLARSRMISSLNAIYRSAAVVLVRDRQLMAYSASALSRLGDVSVEFACRIVFSRWFTRIWTFQEAFAARRLKFCMTDVLVDCQQLIQDLGAQRPAWQKLASRTGSMGPLYIRDIWDFLEFNLQSLSAPNETKTLPEKVDVAFASASPRRTSHVKDELVCLCGIVGLTQSAMMRLLSIPEDEERTKHVLTLLQGVPHSLVTSGAERLRGEGFRWCPQRIIRKWIPQRLDLLQVTPRGALGTWKTLYFTFPQGFKSYWEMPKPGKMGSDHSMFRINIVDSMGQEKQPKISFAFVTRMKMFQSFMRDAQQKRRRLAVLTPPFQDTTKRISNSVLVFVTGKTSGEAKVGHRIAPCGLSAIDIKVTPADYMRGSIAPGEMGPAKDSAAMWLIDGDGQWLDD